MKEITIEKCMKALMNECMKKHEQEVQFKKMTYIPGKNCRL